LDFRVYLTNSHIYTKGFSFDVSSFALEKKIAFHCMKQRIRLIHLVVKNQPRFFFQGCIINEQHLVDIQKQQFSCQSLKTIK